MQLVPARKLFRLQWIPTLFLIDNLKIWTQFRKINEEQHCFDDSKDPKHVGALAEVDPDLHGAACVTGLDYVDKLSGSCVCT